MSPNMPQHDWSTLLTEWHLLNSCETIASATRVVAFLGWASAKVLAAWLLASMGRERA